jgi:thiol:disulfide interchange protein DsbD
VHPPLKITVMALGLALAGNAMAQDPPIGFRIGAERTEVRPGGTLVLTVTARIPRGWHLYGMRQPPGGPMPTLVTVGPERVFSLAAPVTSSPAKAEFDPNFGLVVAWHDDSAMFRLPLRAARTALPRTYDAQVRISYQRCNDRICLPLRTDTLTVPLTIAGPPAQAGLPGTSARQEPAAGPDAASPDSQATMLLLGDTALQVSGNGRMLRYLLPAAVVLMLLLAASAPRRRIGPPG